MRMESLVDGARKSGIKSFGITDHIHTPFNYPDIIESRKDFATNRRTGFHFGVEVSCVSKWELEKIKTGDYSGNIIYGIRKGGPVSADLAIAIDEEYIRSMGIEYVIGGTHWPMYTGHKASDLIREYHRQNMYMSNHPLIEIIAHPWWYYGPCNDGWTKDFSIIPNSIHREFAASCIENDKLVEINLAAMLLTANYSDSFKMGYLDYLVYLKELGVSFSIGSDCHNEYYDIDFPKAADMLSEAGFMRKDFRSPVKNRQVDFDNRI
jgi:histidinol phosphatase-like PHP family hydrolase